MAVKPRREREKLKRRDEILDAAERIFIAKGFEAATMDEVASEAELSKGTIYLYYRSKEELILAADIRAIRKLYKLFCEAIAHGKTGMDKIKKMGEVYLEFATNYPQYFDLILHCEKMQLEQIKDQPLVQEYFDIGEKSRKIVSEAVIDGMADGSIRIGLNSEITGMLLWALSRGFVQFIIRSEIVANRYDPGRRIELINSFYDLIVNGLKK